MLSSSSIPAHFYWAVLEYSPVPARAQCQRSRGDGGLVGGGDEGGPARGRGRRCRYPVAVAATEQVAVAGIDDTDPDTEPPQLVTFNVVSQPGLQRRQVYYPNISWRLSRVLQASSPPPRAPCDPSHTHTCPCLT